MGKGEGEGHHWQCPSQFWRLHLCKVTLKEICACGLKQKKTEGEKAEYYSCRSQYSRISAYNKTNKIYQHPLH